MRSPLLRPIRFAKPGALVLLVALAACGKMAPPDTPPNSIYPKAYPASATLSPTSKTPFGSAAASGLTVSSTASAAAPLGPPATNGPAFTQRGAWIDPDMHRPIIDPLADQDKWHLTDTSGTFGSP